jgi:dephospho-CoA kinase
VRSGPRRVALTGGIGTGKSSVRAAFEKLGVPTIDADRLARQAIAPGTTGLAAVAARFGPGVLTADRQVDRAALGAIVFADAQARADLEAIVHPVVRRGIDDWYEALDPGTPLAVAEIPLLYETGRDRDFDLVVVAACDPEQQLARVMKRDGLDAETARRRIAAQLPIEDKVRRGTYVVNTGGSLADTDAQVRAVHERLLDRSG